MQCIGPLSVLLLLAIPWDLLVLANDSYFGGTRTLVVKDVTQEFFR